MEVPPTTGIYNGRILKIQILKIPTVIFSCVIGHMRTSHRASASRSNMDFKPFSLFVDENTKYANRKNTNVRFEEKEFPKSKHENKRG